MLKLISEENLKSELRTYQISFLVSLPLALFGIFGLLVFGLTMWEVVIPGQRVSPPKNVDTFSEFTKVMPEPNKVTIIEISGNTYIVVVGGVRKPLPSDYPIYVFDKRGKIISWTIDSGDAGENHPYHKYFSKPDLTREVSLQEALEFVSKKDK